MLRDCIRQGTCSQSTRWSGESVHGRGQRGRSRVRSKEVGFALLSVLAGAAIGLGLSGDGSTLPSPVVYFTVAIVLVGAALVLARYDRLGPFDGELGPPRAEAAIRELILRESQRALRYGGEFAVLVTRRTDRGSVNSSRIIRGSDTVVECRKRQSLIVLPQTTREGATQLATRLDASLGYPASIALIHFPGDDVAAEELCPTLLQLIRQSSSTAVSTNLQGTVSDRLARPMQAIRTARNA